MEDFDVTDLDPIDMVLGIFAIVALVAGAYFGDGNK
jgi:hypothetical protein